ncbi:hypothetical protein ACVWWO_002189 [Bradyrhizobium sp. F1.13.1]
MAKAKKQTTRGRNQDRARVAGGQDYEVQYEAGQTGRSKTAVKKAVKRVGTRRRSSGGWGVEASHLRDNGPRWQLPRPDLHGSSRSAVTFGGAVRTNSIELAD